MPCATTVRTVLITTYTMASRRVKKQFWNRLQWHLKLTGNSHTIQRHSARVLAWPSQSHQVGCYHSATLKPQLSQSSRLLSVAGVLGGRLGYESAGPGQRRFPITRRADSRQVSFVADGSTDLRSPVGPENILRSPHPDIQIPPELSLHHMIFDICDKYKDKLAVVSKFTIY